MILNFSNASSYESDYESDVLKSYASIIDKFINTKMCIEQFPEMKKEQENALAIFEKKYKNGIFSLEKAFSAIMVQRNKDPKLITENLKSEFKGVYVDPKLENKTCSDHSESLKNGYLKSVKDK